MKTATIKKVTKKNTSRIFFYVVNEDNKRITSTFFQRKWEAEKLAKLYINS